MDAQTREAKLRAARAAAGSAVLNGVDPDQVREAVEAGIAMARGIHERRPAGEQAASESGDDQTGNALSDWTAAVKAHAA